MEKNINAVQLGRLGGLSTSKKLGAEHYRKLAEHMNRIKREQGRPGRPGKRDKSSISANTNSGT